MRFLCLLLSFAMIFRPCGTERKKRVALTFDDGPHAVYTAQILQILYEYGVMATFFVVGYNAERYPELLRAQFDLGHEIGNHTYSHTVSGKSSLEKIEEEIKTTDRVISSVTGAVPTLFRPPEGKAGRELLDFVRRLGKTAVIWDVDTRDWAHTSPEKIAENVKKNVHDGSVILMHDFVAAPSPTPEALKLIIPYLIDAGYEFVTVSELLAEEAETGSRPSYFLG